MSESGNQNIGFGRNRFRADPTPMRPTALVERRPAWKRSDGRRCLNDASNREGQRCTTPQPPPPWGETPGGGTPLGPRPIGASDGRPSSEWRAARTRQLAGLPSVDTPRCTRFRADRTVDEADRARNAETVCEGAGPPGRSARRPHSADGQTPASDDLACPMLGRQTGSGSPVAALPGQRFVKPHAVHGIRLSRGGLSGIVSGNRMTFTRCAGVGQSSLARLR